MWLSYDAAQGREFSAGAVVPDLENHGRVVVTFIIELRSLAVRKYASAIHLACEFMLKEDDHAGG
jgi:hypothetical protein